MPRICAHKWISGFRVQNSFTRILRWAVRTKHVSVEHVLKSNQFNFDQSGT